MAPQRAVLFNFEKFKKKLDDAIRPHWDKLIYQDMIDEYESEPERIDDLGEAKERMRNRVDRYLDQSRHNVFICNF